MNSTFVMLASAACACVALAVAVSGQDPLVHEHVVGLRAPMKLVAHDSDVVFVAEAGTADPNTGRVSVIVGDRRRFTVIDGLPSGLYNREPSGPAGVLLVGRRLFITIGSGDATVPGPVQGSELPNPTPSSPLLSSILLVEFTGPATDLPVGFSLPPEWHRRVAAGEGVYLHNADGEAVRLSRLVDFPDYVAEPRPDVPDNVRVSNPFGLVGHDPRLDVNDASRNLVFSVDVASAQARVLTRFPSVPNGAPMGPPMIDPVPASIRAFGDRLLVSYLTGFPFAAGNASVQVVDRHTGLAQPLIGGLQTAIDVLPITRGPGLFYVLEYSRQFTAGAPGRVLRVDALDRTPLVLADTLDAPTSLAVDPRTGDLLVSEQRRGRIVRVQVP